MPRLVTCLACALLVLAAVWSLLLGGTVSAYTAATSTPSGSLTAAADSVAPTISAGVIGRSTAYDTGSIAQGTTYYAYANAGDSGNPPSGVASLSANLSSLTAGKSSVAMTAGTYSAGGVSYGFRSPSETAGSPLTAGTGSFVLSATDSAANSTTQSFTTIIDNTSPTGADVQATNVAGGTAGRLELGDTLTLTYSQAIDPYSVLAGWTGSATTNVQVELINGGLFSNDYIQIYTAASSPVQLPLGQVDLGSTGYQSFSRDDFGAYGASTPSIMIRTGSSITITLGSSSGSPDTTHSSAATMTWSPSASVTDVAGNPASTATVTESGVNDVNF